MEVPPRGNIRRREGKKRKRGGRTQAHTDYNIPVLYGLQKFGARPITSPVCNLASLVICMSTNQITLVPEMALTGGPCVGNLVDQRGRLGCSCPFTAASGRDLRASRPLMTLPLRSLVRCLANPLTNANGERLCCDDGVTLNCSTERHRREGGGKRQRGREGGERSAAKPTQAALMILSPGPGREPAPNLEHPRLSQHTTQSWRRVLPFLSLGPLLQHASASRPLVPHLSSVSQTQSLLPKTRPPWVSSPSFGGNECLRRLLLSLYILLSFQLSFPSFFIHLFCAQRSLLQTTFLRFYPRQIERIDHSNHYHYHYHEQDDDCIFSDTTMRPIHAPEARLQGRQLWDSITKAIGNAFTHDDEDEGRSTSTRFITRTITAGQDDPTPPPRVTRSNPAPRPTPTVTRTSEEELPTAFTLPPEATSDVGSTLALAPQTTKAPETGTIANIDQTTSAPSASATNQEKPEESNSGTTAGIVIGVLAGILVVALLVWFLFNRRKKKLEKQHMQDDDEKLNGPINPFADSAAIRTPTTAPRLSLRPVTQFLPNLTNLPDRRTSRGAGMMLSVPEQQESQLHRPTGGSAWERPTVSSTMNGAGPWDRPDTSMSANSANPFNDMQRIPEEPNQQSRPVSPPSPVQSQNGLAPPPSRSPEPVSPVDGSANGAAFAGATVGAVAAGTVAGGLARKASMRKDLPRPLDLTMPLPPPAPMSGVPPSPAGTEYSVNSVAPGQHLGPSASAAAIAAAGGPPQSTVHRVTLDFKPTMEDEMGLKAGQLVRLLHEYDDGWVSFICSVYVEMSANLSRHCAFALTALSRALFPVPACLLAPLSPVLRRTATGVLRSTLLALAIPLTRA